MALVRTSIVTNWRIVVLALVLLGTAVISFTPLAWAQGGGAMVQFSSASYSVNENAGMAVITVVVQPPSSSTITVNYATSNGTAVAPTDYQTASGQLTFSPGQTSQMFSVSIVDQGLTQGSKTVNLTLSSPINASLGNPATAVLTIQYNDAPKTVQFSSASYSVNENAGNVAITATLSSASTQAVSVNYATSDGSAVAGTDYTNTSGTLTFPAGQTSQSFNVPIINKGNFLGQTVNFAVNLSNPSNGTLGSPSIAMVAITDNDAVPSLGFDSTWYVVGEDAGSLVVNVNLSSTQKVPIAVSYSTTDGAAVAGVDYGGVCGTLNFAAGTTNQTITVPIINKGDYSGNQFDFSIQLSNPSPSNVVVTNSPATVYIADDDQPPGPYIGFDSNNYLVEEAGGSITLNVTLSSAQQTSVTVNYATTDDTAFAGVDYTAVSGTLTFAPGVTSQTITVPIIDKGDFSASIPDFMIQLSNPSPGTLSVTNSPATVYIYDDDRVPTLEFGSSAYSTTETSGGVALTVTLNFAAQVPITVNYATADGSAVAGTDYVAASGTITFSPGQTSQTIVVNLINNGSTSGQAVTFSVTLSNPSPNLYLGTTTATVSILDPAAASPATVYFTATSYAVSEDCGNSQINAQVQVLLTGNPTGAVTVSYTTSNGTAVSGVNYKTTSGTLTWNATDTGQVRTISVPILDDGVAAGTLTVNVTLSNPTNSALGTPSTTVINILDAQVPCQAQ